MTLRRPFYLLLAACVICVPSSSARSDPSVVASASKSTQQKIDLLLQRESEALDRYQQQIAPAIRCDYTDKHVRQACNDMLTRVRDEAQQAKYRIAEYRTSGNRQPTDLFDTYVDLQRLLQDITVFNIEGEFWGNRNREPLAAGYNDFVKLTEVWFTGEMRDTIRDLAREPLPLDCASKP